jgi:hypothetical protein
VADEQGRTGQAHEERAPHRPRSQVRGGQPEADDRAAGAAAEREGKPERALTDEERAHEAHERGREQDKDKPLTERRAEFLTEDERVEQAEQADQEFPSSWSPTQDL